MKASRGGALLSERETLTLIERAQAGDTRSRQVLIERNIGLIKRIIQRWSLATLTLEFDDLLMYGVFGLDKAITNYDADFISQRHPGRRVKFGHHAANWIRSAIGHGVDDAGWTIRVPRQSAALYHRMATEQERIREEHGREPEYSDLKACFPGVGNSLLETLIAGRPEITPLLCRNEDGVEDILELPCPVRFEEQVLDQIWVSDLLDQLTDDFDRWLLIHSFGLEGIEPRTNRELAKLFGVSHTTIDNYVQRAIHQLRPYAYRHATIAS